MKTKIDKSGRIELPEIVRSNLGLRPGDDVILEEDNGHWILKPADEATGLQWEGNILVHRGRSTQSADELLKHLREQRLAEMSQGMPE
jgi:AbrB family looped-hinge helix DNA binding protein